MPRAERETIEQAGIAIIEGVEEGPTGPVIGGRAVGLGWLPDYADWRDYTPEHPKVSADFKRANLARTTEATGLPAKVDLREWCSPIEDQGRLGSCTANAGAGLVEFMERRAHGKHIDVSRLFLYKVTRNLLGMKGDTGAFLRSTMGALALFGAPPEEHYPYVIRNYDDEPPAFCYAFGQAFNALKYVRLDPVGVAPDALLKRIKAFLAASYPSMFGFTVYSSIQEAEDGKIPFPGAGERVLGGHAIMAVGYDDTLRIAPRGGPATKGALLIRNSWGKSWGDQGYGWLPYDYVTRGLAIDWWALQKAEWIETGQFKL